MSQGQSTDETGVFFGRLLCVLGIVLALIGAFFISVATNVLGMILGMLAYGAGSRRLGTLTIVLAVVTLAIGLFIGQGALPGAYDRITNGLSE